MPFKVTPAGPSQAQGSFRKVRRQFHKKHCAKLKQASFTPINADLPPLCPSIPLVHPAEGEMLPLPFGISLTHPCS